MLYLEEIWNFLEVACDLQKRVLRRNTNETDYERENTSGIYNRQWSYYCYDEWQSIRAQANCRLQRVRSTDIRSVLHRLGWHLRSNHLVMNNKRNLHIIVDSFYIFSRLHKLTKCRIYNIIGPYYLGFPHDVY